MIAQLVVDVFATRRIVRLVVEDEISMPIRKAAAENGGRLEYLVNCQSCVSVWAAAVATIAPKPVRYALALSEAAILVGDAAKQIQRLSLP